MHVACAFWGCTKSALCRRNTTLFFTVHTIPHTIIVSGLHLQRLTTQVTLRVYSSTRYSACLGGNGYSNMYPIRARVVGGCG